MSRKVEKKKYITLIAIFGVATILVAGFVYYKYDQNKKKVAQITKELNITEEQKAPENPLKGEIASAGAQILAAEFRPNIVLTSETTAKLEFKPSGAESYNVYRSKDKNQKGELFKNITDSGMNIDGLTPEVAEYFLFKPVNKGAEEPGIQIEVVPYKILADNWYYVFFDPQKVMWGAPYGENKLYQSKDYGDSKELVFDFATLGVPQGKTLTSVFIDSRGYIFVSLNDGKVYRSTDGGKSFQTSLIFRGSNISRIHASWGITEDNTGRIFVGEYENLRDTLGEWRSIANLYWSSDGGKKWQYTDYFTRQGTRKHIHVVKFNRFNGKLYLTDGDELNSKKLWVNNTMKKFDGPLNANGDGWQQLLPAGQGGFTGMTFTKDYRYFSTDFGPDDSAKPTENYFVRTADDKNFEKWYMPAPFNTMSYDMRRVVTASGEEIWATVYDELLKSTIASGIFYSRDLGKTWVKYAEAGPKDQWINWMYINNNREDYAEDYLIIHGFNKTIRVPVPK